ncbi:M73 family metallopeptidase [Patescibacteria group bacterium]|nr:M73 family metallopeptidase [Patescibacteria group bacterium]
MKMNKKILRSLLVVGTLAVLVGGATMAFFSDEEVSRGNTFTSGAIDLKVDSEAHYNGLVCKDGFWANECWKLEGTNFIVNGGFETPVVEHVAGWYIFGDIPGWIIEWESTATVYGGETRPTAALQEYHRGAASGWDPQEGNQYAELDTDWFGPDNSLNGEPALVRIYQEVATTPGVKYELDYYYSPRPGVSSANNELKVRVDGIEVATHARDGGSVTDWTLHDYEFIATGSSTKIEFAAGGDADSIGVFLDGIRLVEMECRSTFWELVGEPCGGTWAETDLGLEHKFFNYADVKPGDWGENTISLHVYDNDAYGCMYFDHLEDVELPLDQNGCTEPEEAAEGGDGCGPDGELAENIEVFMWEEMDGNNIWNLGEEQLMDDPESAMVALNGTVYPLANGEPIEACVTRYVGIYWCAGNINVNLDTNALTCDGAVMGNDAQTDQMTMDVRFYVEQARHNDGFTCDAHFANNADN